MSAMFGRAQGDLARTRMVIGDHIETSGNADCLRAAAKLFDWECGFLDDRDDSVDLRSLSRSGVPILAIENAGGAEDLFRYRPPPPPFAVVVGNERYGLSHQVLRLADRVLQIPVGSVHINTVNVAAAAGIAMHQLSHAGASRLGARGGGGARPALLLTGTTDAIELGSAIRSAACFGWSRLFLDDTRRTWFAADRVTRSLARGASRGARNPIRVFPMHAHSLFDDVCVITAHGDGVPLRRAGLARGPGQLVVIPDPEAELDEASLLRLGRRMRRVRLEVEPGQPCPYRLMASIAIAEIARQAGGLRTVASA
ncbi:MAG TPA: TrmH family RNA methyltransferase [Kofleriaceae bacterium]|nr:TrmH family RNA methyltransferase [Kofleriaceae bacterium]